MSEIAYANQEEIFVVKETVSGTLVKPGANDRVYTVGAVDFGQDQERLEDEQIRASASRFSTITARKLAGEFSFDTYVKPSGTGGTAPEHDVLFECLMGSGGQSGNTYEYTLADELPSFSLWVKKGHTVVAARGATVESAEFSISGDALAMISWSGRYMEEIRAGTAYTASIAGSTLTMQGDGAERFSVGAYVEVGNDDNGGAGYKITAINTSAKTIELDGSPSVSGVQLVTPWWPTAGAEVGRPQHGKLGLCTIEGNSAVILNASVSVTNNIKYYEDEKNNKLVAERYGRPGFREIEGSLTLYFLRSGASYFYRSSQETSNSIIIPVGNKTGYIMELQIPYAEYRTPRVTGDEEFQEEIPFIAVASASQNDEFKIVFK